MNYTEWAATVERGVTISPQMAFAAGAACRNAEVAELEESEANLRARLYQERQDHGNYVKRIKEIAAEQIAAIRSARDNEVEELVNALEKISSWAKAYPLSVFPEPDFKKANEVLKAAGMTLDAISASNMRHVIVQAQRIVDAALGE